VFFRNHPFFLRPLPGRIDRVDPGGRKARGIVSAVCDASFAELLPAPFSESLFTFLQIEQQKQNLKERIVRVEISKVLGEGDDSGNNLLRFIAKDSSKSASPYGQVAFPRDGLTKTGLQREGKGPLVVYFRVHVVSANAAAICEAVGTKFSSDARGAHYDW
jgi:hypothetical protein